MPGEVVKHVTKVPELRKGDQVVVLTGKDAGKHGTVERVVRPDHVIVMGINVSKRHTKPRTIQGRTESAPQIQQGGILDKTMPLAISNVMVVCPSCGQPTRIRHAALATGTSVRVCTRCGEPLAREVKS